MDVENNQAQKISLIDPIYHNYMKAVSRSLADSEFYENFMSVLFHADHDIQFSNKKVEMAIDLSWIDAVEEAIEGLQNIISSPRNVIREEEIIVNVAHARKAGADTVRHLAQNSSMIDDFDESRGSVRPGKLMQKLRDESINIYENALTFSTIEFAHHFVKIRHDAIFGAMGDEIGAKLRVHSEVENNFEHICLDSMVQIRKKEEILETEDKNAKIFARISRLYRVLGVMMNTQFAQDMGKMKRAKGNVVMTNVLKRHPDYKKVVKLWGFLREYTDVGYSVKIVEQDPTVDDIMMENIFHSHLFQYITLKGYLEDEEDRMIPRPVKEEKRTLKPQFIHQIVEELTDNYDLPDIEIRKVLIEELTREQLLAEERAEQLRLIEEAEARRREEEEKRQKERELEEERLRQEEKARQEEEHHQRLLQEAEDRRRGHLFTEEFAIFRKHLDDQIARRNIVRQEMQYGQKDFDTAFKIMEEMEQRRAEEKARIEKRREEERARLAAEKAAQEERERVKAERQAQLLAERRVKLSNEQAERDAQLAQAYKNALAVFRDRRVEQQGLRKTTEEQERLGREAFERARRLKRRRKVQARR